VHYVVLPQLLSPSHHPLDSYTHVPQCLPTMSWAPLIQLVPLYVAWCTLYINAPSLHIHSRSWAVLHRILILYFPLLSCGTEYVLLTQSVQL
jgi:hypothetical protein